MKTSNYIKLAGVALMAWLASPMANAMTDKEKEYLKLYGMIACERVGANQLALSPDEAKVFLDGVEARLKGEIIPEAAHETALGMNEYLANRAEKAMKEQAEKNKAVYAEFWKKVDAEEGVVKTQSGLRYKILNAGEKPMPTEESTVKVDYVGTLPDGREFDASAKHGGAAEFPLTGVVPGFREGLQKVGKGGKIKLYIPAELGYGNRAMGIIPAGSPLIFVVDMLDFK
ncbi:MAG: FKBP-type peptidyl-prolyl cis-trans isomerase [Opitutales bacterium]|nr:FKBP-type peptidyl-prolyl cis-trans isomerase [Opitutales bacterium]